MLPIAEDSDAKKEEGGRRILVAIDDNHPCERALEWALKEFYRPGDTIHMIHVIPRSPGPPPALGAPPVDQLGSQDQISYAVLVRRAQQWIEQRFLTKHPGVMHIVKGAPDADGIGSVICAKADELGAAVVVIASQGKSRFQQFFLGSTSAYVSKSSRAPVCIVH